MKKYILLFIMILVFSSLWGGHHTASSLDEPLFIPGLRLAVMADKGDFDFLLDLNGSYIEEESVYHSLSAGTYYRFHRNLKAGLFYMVQAGARHDEDWVEEDGEWFWKDTNDRYEQILTGDITPRFLLHGLPGKNWVFTIKNRYSYNLTADQQSYLLMPGLSWFYIKDRIPVLNLNGGYGFYFPLSFSDSLIYRQGPWLSGIYHLSEKMKLELSGKYLVTNWTIEKQTVTSRSFKVGLGIILKFN